jgi:membrane-associated phospholipid phosphatase
VQLLHIRKPRLWFVLAVFILTCGAFIARYDYQWTLFLNQHRMEAFARFMGQTIFEGEYLGASDLAIFYMLALFGLYVYTERCPQDIRWRPWHPHIRFAVLSGFLTGLGTVHSLKWVIGRARPQLVLRHGVPFSDWYEFGPLFVTDGVFRGSFPSGHTAAIFLFMTLAYALVHNPINRRDLTIAGWCWGAVTLLLCLAMSVGRTMSLAHWIGDGLATIMMNWMVMHALFFWILRIPDQIHHRFANDHSSNGRSFRELRLCIRLLFLILGLMMITIGIRALQIETWPYLGMLIPSGCYLVIFFGNQIANPDIPAWWRTTIDAQ